MNQKRLLLSFIGDSLFFIPHVINPISKKDSQSHAAFYRKPNQTVD